MNSEIPFIAYNTNDSYNYHIRANFFKLFKRSESICRRYKKYIVILEHINIEYISLSNMKYMNQNKHF